MNRDRADREEIKSVLVAMSGGVDSSVAALLLKENGFRVTGVTMDLGVRDAGERDTRCGAAAVDDAKHVCAALGIPHQVIDFSSELGKIVGNFLAEYGRGRTPNPCVDCNRRLKFGALLDRSMAMGFDFLATGHYARIENINGRPALRKPRDRRKDQTYFLYHVRAEVLGRLLFPLAEYSKEEVRSIARRAGLFESDKPESQDLCFIARKSTKAFLRKKLGGMKPGPIVNSAGKIIGTHEGTPCYTVGQRTGLGISSPEPLYVIAIDPERNTIIAGRKSELKTQGLRAGDINLLAAEWPREAMAKIRYRKKEVPCRIEKSGDGLDVFFLEPQEAVAPGQSVVFYEKDTVLGGGVIEEAY